MRGWLWWHLGHGDARATQINIDSASPCGSCCIGALLGMGIPGLHKGCRPRIPMEGMLWWPTRAWGCPDYADNCRHRIPVQGWLRFNSPRHRDAWATQIIVDSASPCGSCCIGALPGMGMPGLHKGCRPRIPMEGMLWWPTRAWGYPGYADNCRSRIPIRGWLWWHPRAWGCPGYIRGVDPAS